MQGKRAGQNLPAYFMLRVLFKQSRISLICHIEDGEESGTAVSSDDYAKSLDRYFTDGRIEL